MFSSVQYQNIKKTTVKCVFFKHARSKLQENHRKTLDFIECKVVASASDLPGAETSQDQFGN